jgi:hypothetical protein
VTEVSRSCVNLVVAGAVGHRDHPRSLIVVLSPQSSGFDAVLVVVEPVSSGEKNASSGRGNDGL